MRIATSHVSGRPSALDCYAEVVGVRDVAVLVDEQGEVGDARATRLDDPGPLVVAAGVRRADERLRAGRLDEPGAALERPRRVDQRAGDRRVRRGVDDAAVERA